MWAAQRFVTPNLKDDDAGEKASPTSKGRPYGLPFGLTLCFTLLSGAPKHAFLEDRRNFTVLSRVGGKGIAIDVDAALFAWNLAADA
jgi:hypothetical protein